MVKWSDEPRLILFWSDGRVRVRREVHEVKHPSFIVPTLQASGQAVDDSLLGLGLMT